MRFTQVVCGDGCLRELYRHPGGKDGDEEGLRLIEMGDERIFLAVTLDIPSQSVRVVISIPPSTYPPINPSPPFPFEDLYPLPPPLHTSASFADAADIPKSWVQQHQSRNESSALH